MKPRRWFLVVLISVVVLRGEVRGACVGDCSRDGRITVNELVVGASVTLQTASVEACVEFDRNGDERVTIDELVTAVTHARGGCPLTFDEKLERLTWIAYAPTGFDPRDGCPAGFPAAESMRTDLEILHAQGFDGVISFAADCTLDEIPRLARATGFRGVIMGLFLGSAAQRAEEVPNAKAAAEFVDAYGAGNEGLIDCRGNLYDRTTLTAVMDDLRTATGKPVTTAEQIEDYLQPGACADFLLASGDWAFPITHPFNNGIRDPEAGAAFAAERFAQLLARTAKSVFYKETGWPTGADPAATEANQAAYFAAVLETPVRFAFFEAFDQPFKSSFPTPWEEFFGLFRPDRTPKLFIGSRR